MKVLWTHNFDPSIPNAGVFMFKAADGLRELGIDIECEYLGNLRSPVNIMKARRRLKIISREYDLVHAQYGSACALATAAVDSCPKVLSLRGSDWNLYSYACGYLHWHSRLAKMMTRFSIRKYDCIVTVSKRMELELRKVVPNMRCSVIPAPIDLERFIPADKSSERYRDSSFGNEEKWILFTAINLESPVKRYGLAKKAVNIANSKMGNIRLRVANGISHSEIPKYIAECDLILCTSEAEGWPNSIKEALACNIPFVSTDVSDLCEIAEQEPLCRVCPPDPEILAENICEVLTSSDRPDLRKYVSSMSVQSSSKKMLAIYESLLRV